MTKELSKQLCELCGIERKGKLIFRKRDWDGRSWISTGCGYKEFDFVSIPETSVDIIPTKDYDEKNGFQYPYSDIERIKREYDKNGYDFVEFRQRKIDFTKPENFVKLLHLPSEIVIKNERVIPAKNMWWIINMDVKKYGQLAPYYCDDFFIRLILLLQNENKDYNDEFINSIKQSIREAEWVYD